MKKSYHIQEDGEPTVELVSEQQMNHLLAHQIYPLLKGFKYSIHSPSCRLFTIEEVNS